MLAFGFGEDILRAVQYFHIDMLKHPTNPLRNSDNMTVCKGLFISGLHSGMVLKHHKEEKSLQEELRIQQHLSDNAPLEFAGYRLVRNGHRNFEFPPFFVCIFFVRQ